MQTIGIRSIKSLGIQNTLDFEVNHKDHNFYAEGLVTSNSHSVSYASISALTVYLKFKYPLQFFLSLLKESRNEPDPIGEVTKIQNELKYFNIKLLPPHLLKSDFDFTIEGKDIRFGLGSIKGIADKVLEKLIAFRKPHSNKFELFEAANSSSIPINILSALIQAGAMSDESYGMTRSRLVLEAQLWNILTDKEKVLCHERGADFNYDLMKIVKYLIKNNNEKGKPFIKDTRFDTIKKKYSPAKEVYLQNSKSENLADFFYERKLIGYSYSYKLNEIFKDSCEDLIPVEELVNLEESEYVSFVAVINEITTWTSKEKGTKCLSMIVSDETGSYKVMSFNDRIEDMKENNGGKLPKEDDVVSIRGTKKKNAIFADTLNVQTYKVYTKYSDLRNSRKNEE